MTAQTTGRPLTGWHVLAMFVAGFGIIIGVNLTLAFKAVSTFPGLEVPNSYVASQRLASELRHAGSDGIAYDSVRSPGGQCVAVFHPDRVAPTLQGEHLYYHWDGNRITHVVVAGEVIPQPARP